MDLQPLTTLGAKKNTNIILSLGAVRPMKRTLHAIKAFETARDKNDCLQMVVAGDITGAYAKKVIKYAQKSRHCKNIDIRGRVTPKERIQLMKEAGLILVASVKEGWGLIVTEANSQGTPAIAYDVDGLRDSVKHNTTGLLVPDKDYRGMGNQILQLLENTERYELLRKKAWQWSKEFTFENSYRDFLQLVWPDSDRG
jgi:glycosyltransferase involved in cell wall biosynthesis